jgi:hypothetical protein
MSLRQIYGCGYADGALVVLLVAALAHVDVAAKEMFVEIQCPGGVLQPAWHGDRWLSLPQGSRRGRTSLPQRPKIAKIVPQPLEIWGMSVQRTRALGRAQTNAHEVIE